MSVPYFLSFYDLSQVTGFKQALEREDEQAIASILWTNGMDVTQPFLIEICTHRPLTTKIPYTLPRYAGSERIDNEWKASGAMSLEAMIFSSKDAHLRDDLIRMSQTPSYFLEEDFEMKGVKIGE